jgi:predicted methyltransferase
MINSIKIEALTSLVACTLIVGCGQQAAEPPAEEPATASAMESVAEEAAVSIYVAAIASAARPDSDRARDAGRNPADVLEFIGVEPGMTVLDMFTGGGYYAEIIAGVVGEDGKVIAQSNEAYLGFVGDAFEERFGSGRLTNVEVLMAENNELSLAADTFDVVMLVQSFHDLYNSDPDNGWAKIDVPAFFAELKKGLKPGGVVAIIDHTAAAGTTYESGNTVHRIDPAIVVATMQAAGFILDGESDVLRNPDDDLSKMVFDAEIHGKTDRFVMRFLNPG